MPSFDFLESLYSDNVHNWRMNEGTGTTVADDGTSSDTMTLQSSPAWATGRFGGGSLDFTNGSNHHLTAAASTPPANTTVAAWVYPDVVNRVNRIFGYEKVSGDGEHQLYLDNQKITFYWYSSAGNSWSVSTATLTALTASTWHHIALTRTGTSAVVLYLNGVAQSNDVDTLTGTPVTASWNKYVSKFGDVDLNQEFDGKIDSLRVFDSAFTATKIQRLMWTII